MPTKNNSIQMELSGIDAPGSKKPKTYTVRKFAAQYVRENEVAPIKITNRSDVTSFVKEKLSAPLEYVLIIAMDNGNRIIGYQQTEGAHNQCAVFPSNIFRFALGVCAASIIMAHNHPGGSMHASEADWQITERVKKAGALLDLPLVDHLIFVDGDCISMRDDRRWK